MKDFGALVSSGIHGAYGHLPDITMDKENENLMAFKNYLMDGTLSI